MIGNYWKRFVQKEADRYKKEEDAKIEESKKDYERAKKMKSLIRSYIVDRLNLEKVRYEEMYPEPFREGEVLILNRYGIGKESSNGWDCGAQGLLTCVDKEDRKSPIIVRVTKCSITTSFSYEVIDRFIDRVDLSMLYDRYLNEEESAFRSFARYFNSYTSMPIPNHLGMYWDVYFETNVKFQPKWGLNFQSFHRADSEEGKLTAQIWEEESAIENELVHIEERRRDLESQKMSIDEKYRGIKYL
jgi:hypothetical protein